MSNPLLDQAGLPAFARIAPEHVEPALDERLAACRAEIARLTSEVAVPTWETFIEPLEEMDDTLNRTWSPVSHLNGVLNSDALRAAYNACLPKLSDYGTEVGQNEDLFRGYQAVAAQEHLDPTQRKLVENALRDFHLSGVDLPSEKKARYKAISQELSQLTSKYSENLLDATNAWSKLITDVTRLTGLPESALGLARQAAEQRGQEGWLLTLDMPSYIPVMTYADDRELRFEVYQAFATRASDQGPHAGQWDNSENLERILALRHEVAQLLGFANYAERSLATKMARSPEDVLAFLNDLAERSVDQARRELAELESFARAEHGVAGFPRFGELGPEPRGGFVRLGERLVEQLHPPAERPAVAPFLKAVSGHGAAVTRGDVQPGWLAAGECREFLVEGDRLRAGGGHERDPRRLRALREQFRAEPVGWFPERDSERVPHRLEDRARIVDDLRQIADERLLGVLHGEVADEAVVVRPDLDRERRVRTERLVPATE